MLSNVRYKVAIVGTGISGLSAAWLLSQRHDVTVYERADRIGGHSNTILASVGGRSIPVDTGFIVFNRRTYPNLTALFELLKVPTQVAEMSFGVSMDGGALEYSGSGLSGVFGQPRNLVSPRFWSMLTDLVRFYRQAPLDTDLIDNEQISLGDYLLRGQYGEAFRNDHLLPMASAIWSAAPALNGDIPGTRALLDTTAIDVDATTCGGTVADNNIFGEGRLDAFAEGLDPRGVRLCRDARPDRPATTPQGFAAGHAHGGLGVPAGRRGVAGAR
jgi:predicted NAD/FAD-binding protein